MKDRRVVRPPVRKEVDDELAFHVEMTVRELVEAGWSREEARAEAVRRFGDIEHVKRECRTLGEGRDARMKRRAWWDDVGQDVRYALRHMARAPGFALVTVLTLALAIGANTAVFSVVNAVLLRPLPFPEADRLAVVWTRYLPPSGFDIDKFAVSGPEFFDYREANRSFETLGVWVSGTRALTGRGEEAERIRVGFVSHEVLPTLGVPPLHGRWFTEDETRPGGPDVVILGHDLWRTRYGGDPAMVGRSIRMNGEAAEVVGVMPRGFEFPSGARAWMPFALDPADPGGRAGHGLSVLGRLRPGVSMDDVDAELSVLNAGWADEHDHNVGHFLWSQSLKAEVVGDAPDILVLLFSAVGLVLLIACANVANLLLARSERRQTEVGVRTALGAGRGRIVRQLLTESVVLAAVAAVLGVVLAQAGTATLIAVDPEALPRLDEVGFDGRVLAFTVVVVLLAPLAFGTVPALLAGRRGLASVASSTAHSTGGRSRTRLRKVLVAGEVALSVVVVILAGLMARSMTALASSDPGFTTERALTFSVTLPPADYPDDEATPEAFGRLLDRLSAVPGVTAATAATAVPFTGQLSRWDFQLDDRPPRQEGDLAWNARVNMVAVDYFQTLGIPVLDGRTFRRSDGAADPLVAVISRSMAETYWPGERAVGKRFGYAMVDENDDPYVSWMTVVGVVEDQYTNRVDEEMVPQAYLPLAQTPVSAYGVPRTLRVVLHTGVEPSSVMPGVRAAASEFDPDLPLYRVRTLDDLVSDSLAQPRLTTNLLGVFGFLALVLAAGGIYGVIAYSVAGRTREIGVRMALGAGRARVIRLFLGEGARPVLAGLAVGVAAAWYSTRLVEGFLYRVAATDPWTFVLLPLGLLVVGAVASVVPTLRAAGVAPTEALRET